MKRKILFPLFILIILLLSTTCGISPMEEGRSVNEYIFPYTKFTLSDDGTYYSASILEGAAVSEIFIPSSAENNDSETLPVKYFTGFESVDDIVNLKTTTFESSSTEIKLSSLDEAALLNTLKYKSVDESSTTWKNLPELPHTEEEEFLGWFLSNNPTVQIENGNIMVPGYTTLFPKWGTHSFKEVEGKNPTCTEKGYKDYHYCLNTGCDYTTYTELPPLGHSLIKHEEASATCEKEGYRTLCWECSRCGGFFSDERGEEEISRAQVVIEKAAHTSDGTVYSDDTSHWLYCTVCHKTYNKSEHTYGDWYDSGEYRIRVCSYCYWTESKTKEHEWQEVEETDSTCIEKGHLPYYKCTVHEGEYTISNENVEIININKLHSLVDKKYADHVLSDWVNTDSEKHWKVCTVCGEKFDRAEHEFEYIFTESGERSFSVKRSCVVCGATGENKADHSSAFDISASFGNIKVVRGDGNTWTLSYYGKTNSCYWTDERGNKIVDDADPFTVNYTARGGGEFKVFCYAYNDKGKIAEIAFALLTAY